MASGFYLSRTVHPALPTSVFAIAEEQTFEFCVLRDVKIRTLAVDSVSGATAASSE